jgi:broad specificity phosphatase PhoE
MYGDGLASLSRIVTSRGGAQRADLHAHDALPKPAELAAREMRQFDRLDLEWHTNDGVRGGRALADMYRIRPMVEESSAAKPPPPPPHDDDELFHVDRSRAVAQRAFTPALGRSSSVATSALPMPAVATSEQLHLKQRQEQMRRDAGDDVPRFAVGKATESRRSPLRRPSPPRGAARHAAADARFDTVPCHVERSVVKQVILVRHGQSRGEGATGGEDWKQGLTGLGMFQAETTATYLADFLRRSPLIRRRVVTAFASSPSRRAVATAESIWRALERTPADPQDPHGPSLVARVDRRLDERLAFIDAAALEAASPNPQALKLVEAVDAILAPFSMEAGSFGAGDEVPTRGCATEVYVGHSNPWRLAACRALKLPPTAWSAFEVAHGSITLINVYTTGEAQIAMLGAVGHLPPASGSVWNEE